MGFWGAGGSRTLGDGVGFGRWVGLGWVLSRKRRGGVYDARMLPRIRVNLPGLFVTATDTGVGKTVVACAIAWAMRQQRPGAQLAVCKPVASGCRRDRSGLVHEDAEALAYFSDCRLPLDVINPIRFREPLAPAVAAEQLGVAMDWAAVERSLNELATYGQAMIVEGAGGVMVPLDPAKPRATWLETGLFGLPAVVVARCGLGTLNHTAMTVRLLREAGITVAGVVMNGYEADEAVAMAADPSRPGNARWIERMTGAKVLALVPQVEGGAVLPGQGVISPAVLDAVSRVDWWELAGKE